MRGSFFGKSNKAVFPRHIKRLSTPALPVQLGAIQIDIRQLPCTGYGWPEGGRQEAH